MMQQFVYFALFCAIFHQTYPFPQFAQKLNQVKQSKGLGDSSILDSILPGTGPFPDAAHPFIAPGPHDQRGPCPGLNTAANYGYIPRNGIATFAELAQMQTTLYNQH